MSFLDEVAKIAKELGLSFEKEENVRIHINNVVIEVAPTESGARVVLSVQLPAEGATPDEVKESVESFSKALRIAFELSSGELKYELDASLPTYPCMYIVREYSDVNKMVEELRRVLKSFANEE